jgi:hypothetical protein
MKLTNNKITYHWPASDAGGLQYSLRKFTSQYGDLGVDFNHSQQPRLATQIVSKCLSHGGESILESEVWTWSLKKRLQALLAITIQTRGQEVMLMVHCPQSQCGENVELALDLDRFKQIVDVEQFTFGAGDHKLTARLPNGEDQQQWMQLPAQSNGDLARTLIVRVDDQPPGESWEFPTDWLPEFSELLDQYDELMSLQINSSCPGCGNNLQIAVDLEKQLLSILSQEQQKRLLEVHQIALAYHWSEHDIFELGATRRNFYLRQLQGQSDEVPQ